MDEYTPEDIAARVSRGSSWMDENFPGWVNKVDLEKLDLSDGYHCILGQVGGDGEYQKTKHRLDLSTPMAEGLGLDVSVGRFDPAYTQLTNEWKSLIEMRRDAEAKDFVRGFRPAGAAFQVELRLSAQDMASMFDAAETLERDDNPYKSAQFSFTGTNGEQVTIVLQQ